MSTRYRSNAPRFVDETVDGEALIMDMVKGTYYSCVGSSAYAWNLLSRGIPVADVAADLAERYSLTEGDARRDVDAFVQSLVTEEMLVASDGPAPSTADPATPVAPSEYAPLALERFTDLADLILLDPVHDVTEAGWPHATS
jgi:hypothetical protein